MPWSVHFRGGLAIASVFACMMFAALSGSSPATVVAIGSIVIAGMVSVGYTKEFAAGVICNAGTLGILIPPSIVMVVYAAATDVSVGRMFLAGVIPGLLAGGMLMVGIYIVARVKDLPAQPWAGWGEVFDSARDASWGLMLIVIILGGIYGGIFTPTEAAAVAAVYAFLIANFVYRDMGPFKDGMGNVATVPLRAVSVLWHRGHQARPVRGRQADDHAAVHHRQRADPEARADRRAHPADDHRGDACRPASGRSCSWSWSTCCC